VSPDLAKVVRNWRSGDYRAGQFKRGWHPPHPSFFVRREVYAALGGFKLNLRIAADYEFMLRVLEQQRRPVAYLPEVLVKMRTGGASNRSALNIWKANVECYRAWRMNGCGAVTAACAVFRKPFSKLKQLTA
jgi:glycosyltransferase